MDQVRSQGVVPAPSILIVDDDRAFRGLLRDVLEREGYLVLEAEDGLRGVKVFEKSRPAIVLLDILMPAKDGIEAVRDMKKLDPAAIVFTMTAGDWGENNSRSALLLGAKRAFLKPIRMLELLQAIREELSPLGATVDE
jgi:DNA-binding response OmpR family regulator